MKALFLILFQFITQNFNAMAQHSYTKEIILKIHDWEKKPISKTGSITFTVAGKVYHAKYNREKLHYVFDSLPLVKGFLNIQCQGYEPQKYFMRPQDLVFQLGKIGSFYSVRGNGLLYPYGKEKGTYGIELSSHDPEAKDSIEKIIKPFLDSLHLSIISYFHPRRLTDYIYLQATKPHDPKEIIEKLLKNQLIAYAGEAFILPGQVYNKSSKDPVAPLIEIRKGFFPNRLFLEFEKTYNLPDDTAILQITSEEKKRILDKYGLEPDSGYKSVDFQRGYVQITESIPGTVNEVAKLLLLEPAVKKVSVSYTEFSPYLPSIDQ